MLHRMRDLPPEARGLIENLIGRPMTEDETFSIRPLPLRKEGADRARALDVAVKLEKYFSEIDAQHPPVSAEEAADAMDEAMRAIRPGYTPLR